MGCGQKAAYEDEQEEIYEKKIKRLKKKKPDEILKVLESVYKSVKHLAESSDIALPRYAWEMLESTNEELSEFIHGSN